MALDPAWVAFVQRWERLPEDERTAEWNALSADQRRYFLVTQQQLAAQSPQVAAQPLEVPPRLKRPAWHYLAGGCGCLGLLGAALVIIGISSEGGRRDDAPVPRSNVTDEVKTPPPRNSKPVSRSNATEEVSASPPRNSRPKEASGIHIGEEFKLGHFSYTVQRVSRVQVVGNDMVSETAPNGAAFILVYFQIRNDGMSTVTAVTDDFELVDANGRTFTYSSNAATALAMSDQTDDLILTELQPGVARNSITPFLVPEDALAPGLRLRVPEKGFWGTRRAEITLIERAPSTPVSAAERDSFSWSAFPPNLAALEVRPWEALQNSTFASAWGRALGDRVVGDWIKDLNLVASSNRYLVADGSGYVVLEGCRPHFCAQDVLVVLYNPEAQNATALVRHETQVTSYGSPSKEQSRLLRQLLPPYEP